MRERAALRREEIIHFAWHGDTPEQILARLNGEVSIATVRQIVQEWRTGVKRDRKQVAA
jgi:transposase